MTRGAIPGWHSATDVEQASACGRVERLRHFGSRHVDARHVEVWLPPDYEAKVGAGRRFAVLYMHDGQMLFDAKTTWNGKSWHVDQAAHALMTQQLARDFIIVGPWNHPAFRHSEYFPARFLPHLPPPLREAFVGEALRGRARSDDYLRFLVEELKPAIDTRYATRPERAACFLMGSSMGGLISLYGLCEYPRVFGGAAGLSTHWIGTSEPNAEFPAAAMAYLRQSLPSPASVRWWTDRGTLELDANYAEAHAGVTALARGKGFAPPRFVARVIEGAGHDEDAWARRVHEVMRMLLGPDQP